MTTPDPLGRATWFCQIADRYLQLCELAPDATIQALYSQMAEHYVLLSHVELTCAEQERRERPRKRDRSPACRSYANQQYTSR
jgi:hypothetical protein